MKSFLILLVTILSLGIAVFTLAEERCPLTGNTYSFTVDDTTFELSGFDCTFGPGCEANCDLWHGDFNTGPLYHERLPFICKQDGSVIINGIPCALDSSGNLECLLVDTSDYTCHQLGDRTWCVPGDGVILNFEQE